MTRNSSGLLFFRDGEDNSTNRRGAGISDSIADVTHILYVYPGCFGAAADLVQCTRLTLDIGEFILFHGDLVQQGTEFDEENICLHCNVQLREISQKIGSTEAAVFNTYMCEHCTLKCTSMRHLRNHHRYCDENLDKQKKKQQCKEADERGGFCSHYNSQFETRNALDQQNYRHRSTKRKRRQSSKNLHRPRG